MKASLENSVGKSSYVADYGYKKTSSARVNRKKYWPFKANALICYFCCRSACNTLTRRLRRRRSAITKNMYLEPLFLF